MKALSLCIALAAAVSVDGSAQTLLRVRDGTSYSFQAGWALSRAGDINGDSVPDVIIGCHDPLLGNGTVQIINPLTGAVLRLVIGEGLGHTFGYSVAGGRDVDGDNVPDYIVGAPAYDATGQSSFDNRGKAYVYSGLNGSLLHSVIGSAASDTAGTAVALVGDLNGDGRSEFAVGAPAAANGSLFQAGRVTVHSSQNGAVMFTLLGQTGSEKFGTWISALGDVNNDGTNDFLVGAPFYTAGLITGAGRVDVRSGVDGSVIYSLAGLENSEHLGTTVAGIEDINSDGVVDYVVGAPDYDGGIQDSGRARAYSGTNGAFLWQVQGPLVYMKAGLGLDSVPDLTGDGIDDVLVGMPYLPP